jgi:hypothetical protein
VAVWLNHLSLGPKVGALEDCSIASAVEPIRCLSLVGRGVSSRLQTWSRGQVVMLLFRLFFPDSPSGAVGLAVCLLAVGLLLGVFGRGRRRALLSAGPLSGRCRRRFFFPIRRRAPWGSPSVCWWRGWCSACLVGGVDARPHPARLVWSPPTSFLLSTRRRATRDLPSVCWWRCWCLAWLVGGVDALSHPAVRSRVAAPDAFFSRFADGRRPSTGASWWRCCFLATWEGDDDALSCPPVRSRVAADAFFATRRRAPSFLWRELVVGLVLGVVGRGRRRALPSAGPLSGRCRRRFFFPIRRRAPWGSPSVCWWRCWCLAWLVGGVDALSRRQVRSRVAADAFFPRLAVGRRPSTGASW